MVLGLHASQRARQGIPISRTPFKVPSSWSSTSASSSEDQEESFGTRSTPPSAAAASLSSSSSSASLSEATSDSATSSPSSEPDCNELSPEELEQVAQGSLQMLDLILQDSNSHMTVPRAGDHPIVPFLVTAVLSMAMAPRRQVLQQLRIDETFVKEKDGRYWVKMPAELNKHAKPTLFALPVELTKPFDMYLNIIRPRLLRAKEQEHNYVFFKKNGTAPRADFSDLTAMACQSIIGRPVNAHAFRSAVITLAYSAPGVTQTDMDVLANIMAHSPATARNSYYKPDLMKKAVGTSDRMLNLLQVLLPPAPAPAPFADTAVSQTSEQQDNPVMAEAAASVMVA
jgi:hypothetical protein